MNDDDESLFGSPPPSPAQKKPPELALPCARTASNAQNVGTIALPGSHPNSECFFTTSIAPSLSHPGPDQIVEQDRRPCPQTVCSNQVTSSIGTSTGAQKRKRSRQPLQQPPSVPPIDFPEPGRPIPKNFLRNQETLLGPAGLIARVKPSHLLRIAGDHANNPIDIDSDNNIHSDQYVAYHQTPRDTSGRSNSLSSLPDAATANQAFSPFIPSVPKQDVVASLIQQQDVFPVVRSIMKLIAHAKTSSPAAPPPSSSNSPASSNAFMSARSALNKPIHSTTLSDGSRGPKRRKLKSVPAGAEDWDIPFPFSSGEGPEAYRETWEHERGRRLIMQLATLVKAAAQKAATQKVAAQAPLKRDQQTAVPFDHLTYGCVLSAVDQNEVVPTIPVQVRQSDQAPPETNTESISYPLLSQPQPSYDDVISSLLDGVLSPPSEPGGGANMTHPLLFTDDIASNSGDEWFSCLIGPLISFPVADHGNSGRGYTCPNASSPLPVSNEGPAATPENPTSDESAVIDPVLLEEPQPTTIIPPSATHYMAPAPEHGLLDPQHVRSFGSPHFDQLGNDDPSTDSHKTCSSGEHIITDGSFPGISNSHQDSDVSASPDPRVDVRTAPDPLSLQSCYPSTNCCMESEGAQFDRSLSILEAQDTSARAPTTSNQPTRYKILQHARARVAQLQAELDAQKRRILDMEMEAAVLHHLETPKVWSTARPEDVNL